MHACQYSLQRRHITKETDILERSSNSHFYRTMWFNTYYIHTIEDNITSADREYASN